MKFTIFIRNSLALSFLAALFLTLACTVKAQQKTPPVNADKKEAPEITDNLVVTNNIAVVRFSPSAWDRLPLVGGHTANEMVFQLRSVKETVPAAVVTSSGLGNAVFIRESDLTTAPQAGFFNIRRCPKPTWTGVSSLPLSNLKAGEDVKVRIRFPCDLVSDPGDTLEGKILVMAAQHKPLEVPLKIQNPAASPFYTALLWFLGLMIPTLVSYRIYKLQNQWSEERAQWAGLNKYIYENRTILTDFFHVYYQEIFKGKDPEFAAKLAEEFTNRKIMENIPLRERRKIENAITRCNRKAIKKTLGRIFPNWRTQIGGRVE